MSSTPRTNALAKQLRKKEGCNLGYRSEKALLKLCRELERELGSRDALDIIAGRGSSSSVVRVVTQDRPLTRSGRSLKRAMLFRFPYSR